jgi:hypothetical protein
MCNLIIQTSMHDSNPTLKPIPLSIIFRISCLVCLRRRRLNDYRLWLGFEDHAFAMISAIFLLTFPVSYLDIKITEWGFFQRVRRFHYQVRNLEKRATGLSSQVLATKATPATIGYLGTEAIANKEHLQRVPL